ncbi:phosphatidylinositol 3-related kinase, partial [Trypanosoma cruzi]
THLHATCAAQPEELLAAQSAIKKRRGAAGCLRGRTKTAPSIPPSPTNPHTRRRTAPKTLHPIFRITRINRREGQWSLSAKKFTVARRTSDIPALDKLHEGSERGGLRTVCAANVGAENVPSGQFTTFCCTHERTMNEESCAAFLVAIFGVAPLTRRQYARMLRSMLQMD